jgi:hypothetical protein
MDGEEQMSGEWEKLLVYGEQILHFSIKLDWIFEDLAETHLK